jgi:hypothetical protein
MASPDARPDKSIRQHTTPLGLERTLVRSNSNNGKVTERIEKISRTGRLVMGEEILLEPTPGEVGSEPKDRIPRQEKP